MHAFPSCSVPASHCSGTSGCRARALERAGSVAVAHRPSSLTASAVSPGQVSHPGPLHWQVDSQPLGHQESPGIRLVVITVTVFCSIIIHILKKFFELEKFAVFFIAALF